MYGQCDQMLVPGPQQYTTVEFPNSVTLTVPENFNCYEVKASNNNFTIIVEGRMSVGTGKCRRHELRIV